MHRFDRVRYRSRLKERSPDCGGPQYPYLGRGCHGAYALPYGACVAGVATGGAAPCLCVSGALEGQSTGASSAPAADASAPWKCESGYIV